MTPETKELIHEGENLEKALSNGHRGDPGTISDAIRYLIRTNRIQLHAEYVSDKTCRDQRKFCPGMANRWNWAKTVATLGSIGMMCGLALRIWG